MPDPDQNPTTPTSPGEAPPSLREIAEANFDRIESGADDTSTEPAVDAGGQPRDGRGRWASKDGQPGEAEPSEAPSPDDESGTQPPERPTQPPQGSSSEAPANWADGDRQSFAKLPQEAKDFVLRRHSEMEGEFQRRVQQYGAAAQFTEQLAPVFRDPVIARSLQESGMVPAQAIAQWAAMHRRAYDPDPAQRLSLLHDIAQNIGLNPAAVFANQSRSDSGGRGGGFSEADLQDPAIRHIAEQFGTLSSELRAQRDALHQIRQAEQQSAQQQTLKVTRWGIDNFADEKGQDGKPLRPHFDRVLPHVIELFRADPNRDLKATYEMACWMDPAVREEVARSEAAKRQQAEANQRAAQAARTNLRGRTAPVSTKPNGAEQAAKTLRQTLEDTADELGF
jgi:hypothetical protein